ncbi:MAG: HAD-IA family hydrolase [Elusimicrobiaceae bacterium]|nr:HAD-IA family hydrolase [Elusimicrobiaceae bacterium]
MMSFLEQIKQQIDKAEVISFDLFDTLLLRPYVQPEDVFVHLGLLHNVTNFKNIRLWAFAQARATYCVNGIDEVTLDEIYEFMPEDCKFMQNHELAFEKRILQANAEMKEVWDYARAKNKKVIVVSDMYLPEQFLKEILAEKGFAPDELFVSSTYKQLKGRGPLYQIVLDKLQVSPTSILHVGDNPHSDVKKAQEYGWQAVLYPKVIDRYFNLSPRAKTFYDGHKQRVITSILLGTAALSLHNQQIREGATVEKKYWQKLGVEYAGPLACAFMSWLCEKVKEADIREVLFVARDGYTLRKVFQRMLPQVSTHYIYAPRIISLAATLDFGKKFELNEFEPVSGVNALIRYFKEYYPAQWKESLPSCVASSKEAFQFLTKYDSLLKRLAELELKKYENYLASLNLSGSKVAFVDMMTTFFTGHHLIQKALPKHEIKGFYYWISDIFLPYYKNRFQFESFSPFPYHIPFVEMLITSPEPPIIGLQDNQPVYTVSLSKEEKLRKEVYPAVEEGVLAFAQQLWDIFEDTPLFFDDLVLADWLRHFEHTPQPEDKIHFARLCHAWEINHSNYQTIFPGWYLKGKPGRKLSFIEKIFSVRNEGACKVIRVLGMKFKLNRTSPKNAVPGFKVYSEKVMGKDKTIKIFGIKIYSKKKYDKYWKRKYFGGLLKIRIDSLYKKVYLFGIKLYQKVNYSSILTEIQRAPYHTAQRNAQITQRLLQAAAWHQKAFAPYKAAFRGREVVLMGAGPTLQYFEPIANAVYVGCNRAFKYDKVAFDFLFSCDKVGIEKWYDDFFNYRKDTCVKFIGDQNLGVGFQIPENKIPLENVYRYVTYAGIEECSRFNMDIATSPLHNAATVTLQALQFILYTQPKRIYLVGIDCTAASKQYFVSDGQEYDNALRKENVKRLDEINIRLYGDIKRFAEVYYPDTEIISVNPVGLKGLFTDIYTSSNPEGANEMAM